MLNLIQLLLREALPLPKIGSGRVHEIADDHDATADSPATFVCTGCGQDLPRDAYYNAARKDGSLRRLRQCKRCHTKTVKALEARKKGRK